MIVVADASVLVGELLRRRGRELLLHPDLRVLVAEHQWEETEHELSDRLEILESRGIFTAAQREALERSVRNLIDVRAIEVAPRDTYAALESTALRRVRTRRAAAEVSHTVCEIKLRSSIGGMLQYRAGALSRAPSRWAAAGPPGFHSRFRFERIGPHRTRPNPSRHGQLDRTRPPVGELIIRRSQVRILPPLPQKRPGNPGLFAAWRWKLGVEDSGVFYVAPSQAAVDCLTGAGRMPAEGEALIAWMVENESRWRLHSIADLRPTHADA
jgi:hypothetical protein